MGKKQNAIITQDTNVFSNLDIETLTNAKAIITECQLKAEGLAERIAGQLYLVNEKKLYMIEDYKTLHEWAGETFDISKGTCSDAVNTYKRFGSRDNLGAIDDKYCEYSFSTLMRMKNLSDEQIELAGINPTMSRTQVIEAVKALKVIEEKEAQRPQLEKAWTEAYKKLNNYITEAQERIDWILAIVPEFFDKDHRITVGEYETLINAVDEYIYAIENPVEEDEPEESSTVEHDEPEESSTVEHDEPERTSSEYHIESGSTEKEEPHTMPTITFNLGQYMKDGNLTKKVVMDDLWKAIQQVVNHEADVLVTFTV